MAPQAPKRPLHTRNADLAKYRSKAGALGEGNGAGDKLLRFVLQLLVLAVFRSVQALSIPFGKLFAVWFWMGKSVINISVFLEKQLLKAIAWMSGTGFGRDSRLGKLSHYYLGVDVKRWHVGIAALVLGGVVHSAVSTVRGLFDERLKRMKQLQACMATARTYDEWRMYAVEYEQLKEQYARPLADHQDYDRRLLNEKLRHLKQVRAKGDPREMMSALRSDLIRNVANITKRQKHSPKLVQTPEPIQAYIREVQEQLEELANWNESDFPVADKAAFFKVTRHSFGRTALLLSGGGGLGTFHLGVCKALFEKQVLPRVMAGSSVGSIVCAAIAVRTDAELVKLFGSLEQFDIALFQNTTVLDLVKHALNKGHLQDVAYLLTKLQKLVGNYTFLEAFNRTGRILNVTVCPADTNEPPRLLNYMTAPEALVWSAVACSSAFPGLYPPQYLMGKNNLGQLVFLHTPSHDSSIQRRWRDGSLEFDLPVKTLAETFNCNHFLVSQTNPHIVPLLNIKSVMPAKWASIMEAELKHRLQVVQWLFPEWSISRYLTLFTQPWEGDITFTLPSMLWNLRKTIVNPTPDELVKATQVGRYATWERMGAIECNCSIEATLDVCSARLQKAAQKQASRAHGPIPSWICLPGHPNMGQSPVGQSSLTLGQPGLGGLGGTVLGASYADGITDNDASEVASWGESCTRLHLSPSRIMLGPGPTPSQLEQLAKESAPVEGAGLRVQAPLSNSSLLGLQHATDRLPPIASHPPSEDSYESASSLGTGPSYAGPMGHPQSIGSLRREAAGHPQSTGISRKSSVMAGLNTMEHPEWTSSVKMSNLSSKCPSARSSHHQTSPSDSRSGRSSADISLAEAHAHAHAAHVVPEGAVPVAAAPAGAAVGSTGHGMPRPESMPGPTKTSASWSTAMPTHQHTHSSFNGIAVGKDASAPAREPKPAPKPAAAAPTNRGMRSMDPSSAHSTSSMHNGEALRDPAFEQMLLSMRAEPVPLSENVWQAFLPLANTCVTLGKGPGEAGSVLPVGGMAEDGSCSMNVVSL